MTRAHHRAYRLSDLSTMASSTLTGMGATQFLEQPSWREVMSDTVNTGIYVISRSFGSDCAGSGG
jgi:NDP-sugar pyrophosphorylase family protein